MAGTKFNTKTKGKEEKNKINKGMAHNEESDEPDFALLRKSIPTSVTGFAQARKIFDVATEELKGLLSNECDLLYECKVCRNIFRSLANFLSHKRIYCKETFKPSIHAHFVKANSLACEVAKINRIEQGYQDSLKEQDTKIDVDEDNDNSRIPISKDLTTVLENITKTKGITESNQQQVVLQKIPNSSVAVFQNVNYADKKECDVNMSAEVMEVDNILSQDQAVLQSDGNFKITSNKIPDADGVIQISDDDDNDDSHALKCKICNLQFSTQKTLKFHIKYKHLESRLVYPCPDCLEIFSTSWSVYRHLFKVHRKTAAQIRRLRESIQAKAFRMNNPPASYEKRKNNMKTTIVQKISEEERLDQENQAWMDNMEGDGEVPRCGGCGRTFERRAALAAHTYTCQPRSRALSRRPVTITPASVAHPSPITAAIPQQESKKIEIQIRKDYNKSPAPAGLQLVSKAGKNKDDNTHEETRKKGNEKSFIKENNDTNEEIIGENVYEQKSSDIKNEIPDKSTENSDSSKIKLPFSQQAEKNNLIALKQKIKSDIEIDKLLCKKCDMKCDNAQDLFDHMAEHVKWVRYACKLCNYKHYNFEKLLEHVQVSHKLNGDKDFYYTTVKAIGGTEARELCESLEDLNDNIETPSSSNSRRPSRCSSDSSRLSDESSSSSTRVEIGSKKRKSTQNKYNIKKKKTDSVDELEEQKSEISVDAVRTIILGNNDSSSSSKLVEENSSDIDDIEEKISKRHLIEEMPSSLTYRRPVRKRTKPKNEDFEYDLSNLLKLEAQGYRDSQSVVTSKSLQSKKKINAEPTNNNFENINKDCCGALVMMTRKSIAINAAHLKVIHAEITSKKERSSSGFIRPMLPRSVLKCEKLSPKKDFILETKDVNLNNATTSAESVCNTMDKDLTSTFDKVSTHENITTFEKEVEKLDALVTVVTKKDKEEMNTELQKTENIKTSLCIQARNVVPIKFRRPSLEVMKNPIINKNIKDFTKAGMQTKILVIKPIHRNSDGLSSVSKPLKFQTIKLKDGNKKCGTFKDDSISDKPILVKVPKVDCALRATNESSKLDTNTNDKDSATKNEEANISKNDSLESHTGFNVNSVVVKSDVDHPCTTTSFNSVSDKDNSAINVDKQGNNGPVVDPATT